MVWSLYKHQDFFGQLKLLNKQKLNLCQQVSTFILFTQATRVHKHALFFVVLKYNNYTRFRFSAFLVVMHWGMIGVLRTEGYIVIASICIVKDIFIVMASMVRGRNTEKEISRCWS